MDEETANFVKLLRHYAKLLHCELPAVMNKAADMIEELSSRPAQERDDDAAFVKLRRE